MMDDDSENEEPETFSNFITELLDTPVLGIRPWENTDKENED